MSGKLADAATAAAAAGTTTVKSLDHWTKRRKPNVARPANGADRITGGAERRLTSINYGHQFHVDRCAGCHATATKKEPSEPKAVERAKEAEEDNGILNVIQNK